MLPCLNSKSLLSLSVNFSESYFQKLLRFFLVLSVLQFWTLVGLVFFQENRTSRLKIKIAEIRLLWQNHAFVFSPSVSSFRHSDNHLLSSKSSLKIRNGPLFSYKSSRSSYHFVNFLCEKWDKKVVQENGWDTTKSN